MANSCTLLLKNERAETSEKIRKLDWALLLERSAHKRLKENPLGHQLGPTREEVQERLAKERERAARWEHKRQAAIEQDLRRKLAEKIERERDPERRAEEEAAAEQAKRAWFRTCSSGSIQGRILNFNLAWVGPVARAGTLALRAQPLGNEHVRFCALLDCHVSRPGYIVF